MKKSRKEYRLQSGVFADLMELQLGTKAQNVSLEHSLLQIVVLAVLGSSYSVICTMSRWHLFALEAQFR